MTSLWLYAEVGLCNSTLQLHSLDLEKILIKETKERDGEGGCSWFLSHFYMVKYMCIVNKYLLLFEFLLSLLYYF